MSGSQAELICFLPPCFSVSNLTWENVTKKQPEPVV